MADILKLKTKAKNRASFCVSLNSAQVEKIARDPKNWPTGVVVRQYHRKAALSSGKSRMFNRVHYYGNRSQSPDYWHTYHTVKNWKNEPRFSYEMDVHNLRSHYRHLPKIFDYCHQNKASIYDLHTGYRPRSYRYLWPQTDRGLNRYKYSVF